MRKAWALIEMDGCVLGHPFSTEEAAQAAKESLSYFGDMVSVEEIDFNDEPLSEHGKSRMEELKSLFENSLNFHMSKTPKYFQMSADEKVEFMINILTTDGEPVDFDEDFEEVDVSKL